jgi:hypothetical protein
MQTSPITPTIIPNPNPETDLIQIHCSQQRNRPIPSLSTPATLQNATSDNDIWQQLKLIHSWIGI